MGIYGSGFSLGRIPGYQSGFEVVYKDANNITVKAGAYECDGDIFTLAADHTHLMSSIATGFNQYYIYLDKSASTATVPAFYHEAFVVASPVWDAARNGYYHPTDTEDRLVGLAHSTAGVAAMEYFSTTDMGGGLIRNTMRPLQYSLASNMSPASVWQTPNTNESSVYLPVNAVEACILVGNSDLSGGTVHVSWVNSESAAVLTNMEATTTTFQSHTRAYTSLWGPLGASRNIKIACNGGADNLLLANLSGLGYRR